MTILELTENFFKSLLNKTDFFNDALNNFAIVRN